MISQALYWLYRELRWSEDPELSTLLSFALVSPPAVPSLDSWPISLQPSCAHCLNEFASCFFTAVLK